MRILYSIHLYPPKHNCGGEYYIHNLNKYLISQGHEVRIMLHQAHENEIRCPYRYEGVDVYSNSSHLDAYRWADVLVTHLDFTHFTVLLGWNIGKPVVHIVHNHHKYNSIDNGRGNINVVYNSKWISEELKYRWPSVVVTPGIDVDKFDINENPEANEYITLINLNTNKGGRILQKIAAVFPEKNFIGVIGSYGEQITRQPGNVVVLPNTPDILSVYKKTRLLIMPSQYESWGMTATEAMCSGIPVICTPTPGLLENCGDAGNYILPRRSDKFDNNGNVIDDTDEYDITSLVEMIKRFDDKKFYYERSIAARERSRLHHYRESGAIFEDFLYQTAELCLS